MPRRWLSTGGKKLVVVGRAALRAWMIVALLALPGTEGGALAGASGPRAGAIGLGLAAVGVVGAAAVLLRSALPVAAAAPSTPAVSTPPAGSATPTAPASATPAAQATIAAPQPTRTGGASAAPAATRQAAPAVTQAFAQPALVAGASGLSVYVGYADNIRPSGFFPTPWQASPNVIFEGCTGNCTFDGGAVRIDNNSGSSVTVNSLAVAFGACQFAIWPQNLTLPAGNTLIFTQTINGASNGCPHDGTFDMSDVSGAGNCAPNGIIPQVTFTIGGVQTTFRDTQQVLNTGGVDLADCPATTNESQPWSLLGGGVTAPQLNGNGSPASPQVPQCNSGAPVNCATGNFWETYTELAIAGRGMPLNLSLTYNSLGAAQASPFGFGWSFTYGASLVLDPTTGNATVIEDNGSTVPFTNSGGNYTTPPWVLASLVKNGDNTFTFTLERSRQQDVFSSTGQLLKEIDSNGYTTTLAYNGTQLTSVTDPAGRKLTLAYGSNGDVASVTDLGGRQVGLAYDGSGNLATVTNVAGNPTKFTLTVATDCSHGPIPTAVCSPIPTTHWGE
jgi:YD repeat-containing protein